MDQISIPVSVGELIDKITILEIKSERITDRSKLSNIQKELALLRKAWADCELSRLDVGALTRRLKSVNETLWEIEDGIRIKEAEQSFDSRFVELARSVYRHNDRRSSLKRQINEVTGSDVLEEKDYPGY